jgi:hypothetical protein
VRLAGAEPVFATTSAGFDFLRILAHRAFCARAILRREAADIIRVGRPDSVDTADDPLKDSIPEITWSNLSISTCVRLRFSRSSCSALSKFDIVYPLGHFDAIQLYKAGVICGSRRWFWGEVAFRSMSQDSSALVSTHIYNNRLQPCWMYSTTGTALAWGNTTLCSSSESTAGNMLDLKYNYNLGSDNGSLVSVTNPSDSTLQAIPVYATCVSQTQAFHRGSVCPRPSTRWPREGWSSRAHSLPHVPQRRRGPETDLF